MKRTACLTLAIAVFAAATRSTGAADLTKHSAVQASACAARAPEPLAARRFTFTRDEAPHDGFATEWWRTFGRLSDMAGHTYDVSMNVSRFAIDACGEPADRGAWAATHIITSAYELLDERTGRIARASHVEREGPLGATSAMGRLDIAIAGLRLRGPEARGSRAEFTIRLQDVNAAFAIEERTRRDAVPLGPNGVMQTGSSRTCTAYAYAYPKAAARGSLSIDGERHAVAGTMWMEHEFAHRELDGTDIGWLRFDLSLDDGRTIDVRFTRQHMDGADLISNVSGVIVSRNGLLTYLNASNASEAGFPPNTTWHSVASGVTYESAWTVDGFDASEAVQDQEIFTPGRAPYYMGAADFDADSGIKGTGYVELTGFGAPVSL